jgi:peptidoglycan LD-endopeptidase CwlK
MNRNINDLHPILKDLCNKFIIECKKQNIDIIVTSTYRSIKEQNELYAQGRTKKGKIVTWVKGGGSMHNYNLAFDFAILNGKSVNWNIGAYKKPAEIGKKLGLEMGYFWKVKDACHAQLNVNIYKIRYKEWIRRIIDIPRYRNIVTFYGCLYGDLK